jgi:CubicO group peptidase (beta-lactamase class C family)
VPEVPEVSLDHVAQRVVKAGVAPSATVAVAARSASGFRFATGRAGTFETELPPIFDLASVSKPFLAVTAARLARSAALSLDDALAKFLPELGETESGDLPLIAFLSHRAGLESHRTLFAPLLVERPFERAGALLEAARARRADAVGPLPEAGFTPLYSDLGYVLVGAALERATGLSLDELVEREVSAPLGLDVRSARLFLRTTRDFAARVVETETVSFRGGRLRGIVHDENAWALAGHGAAGQAGLFGDALSLASFGAALLDALSGRDTAFLERAAMEELVRPRPLGTLRAGFDGKSEAGSSAGNRASAATFGHLGFTGTSMWCDPLAERVVVLLSNRVCPTRDNVKIRDARPRVHDELFEWAEGLVSGDQP